MDITHASKLTFNRDSAAAMLGVCVRTLDEARARGQIGHIKLGTGKRARVLFRQADLDIFLARNFVAPRPNAMTGGLI